MGPKHNQLAFEKLIDSDSFFISCNGGVPRHLAMSIGFVFQILM